MVSFSPRTVCKKCTICGKKVCMKINPVDLAAWKRGTLIQDAMPYLSDGEREILISKTCGECWDAMFGEEAT